jgi:hypothetical protein
MIGVMIIVDKTTTTAMTTVARSLLHYHRQKGATPTVRFQTTNCEINFIVRGRQAAKSNR